MLLAQKIMEPIVTEFAPQNAYCHRNNSYARVEYIKGVFLLNPISQYKIYPGAKTSR